MNLNKYHKPFKDELRYIFYLKLLIIFILVTLVKGQTCPEFSLPTYGTRPLQCDNQRGSRCYIGCQNGYELIGNCFRICTSSGQWSGSEPQCINRNIQCPLLQVYDGLLEQDCPRLAGTRCNVRCNIDMIQRSLLCQENGQWNPDPSTISCLRLPPIMMSCPPISRTQNLKLSGECNPSKTSSVCYFSCENGYMLSGPSFIQCLNTGQWSANQPFCVPSTIPTQIPSRTCTQPPPSIDNMGQFQGNCSPGYAGQPCYALAGNPAVICQDNGQWQGTIPNCVQIFCKGLTDPTNGQVSKNCLSPIQNLLIGQTCTFTCDTNFQIKGNRVLTCLQNGQWDSPQPTCERIECSSLLTPQNGKLEGDCAPGVAGSTCTLKCLDPTNYVLNGNDKTTCQPDGTWSASLGVCDPILCSNLPQIQNGMLTGVCSNAMARIRAGQMCAYQCNNGYMLSGSSAILECLSTGLWSDSVPSCVPSPAARCAPLPIISCASMTGICTDAMAGQICRYVCTTDTCSGDVELTCTADGTWQGGNLPSCDSKVNCRSLKIQVGASFIGDCRPGLSGKTCTVVCKQGYRLYGTVRTIICLSNGQWSNTVPRCIQIRT